MDPTNPLLRKAGGPGGYPVILVISAIVSADFGFAFRGRRPIGCSIRHLPAAPSSTPASIHRMW